MSEELKKLLPPPEYVVGAKDSGNQNVVDEEDDTLRSSQRIGFLDLLSEGELEGLCFRNPDTGLIQVITAPANYGKAIYLDRVPMINPDGSKNFNATVDFTPGIQDQAPMKIGWGYNTGLPTTYGRLVRKDASVEVPFSAGKDMLLVNIRTGAFLEVHKDSGKIAGSGAEYSINIRYTGSEVLQQHAYVNLYGKTRDTYHRTNSIHLDGSGRGGTLVIKRHTEDSNSINISNSIYLDSVVELTYAKLSYPNSSLVSFEADSEKLTNISERQYYVRGIKVKVPSNYDPVARTYDGPWTGEFDTKWTNNPAWIYYDLLTNWRYGLGRHTCTNPEAEEQDREYNVDKWGLYEIAQYCDEPVDNGAGGTEPRFTCNVYIRDAEEAYSVLRNLASVFRGMVYWSAGMITAVQDRDSYKYPTWDTDTVFAQGDYCAYALKTYRSLENSNQHNQPDESPSYWEEAAVPVDSVMVFTPANVKDGVFNYTGSAKKARHTVAMVSYYDPTDMFAQKVEYVEDRQGILDLGMNVLNMVSYATTSRGQAYRTGKAALLTEIYGTETVKFTAGIEAAMLRPGHIVSIVDPIRYSDKKRMGGRLLDATTTVLTLDAPVTLLPNKQYYIYVIDPNHTLKATTNTAEINNLTDLVLTSEVPVSDQSRTLSEITLDVPLTTAPQKGTTWALAANDELPHQFKVLAVAENGTSGYDVIALQYVPAKYSAIEHDMDLDALPTDSLPNPYLVIPPSGVRVLAEEVLVSSTGTVRRMLAVGWTPSTSPSITNYIVEYSIDGDGNWISGGATKTNEITFEVSAAAQYAVRVRASNTIGIMSIWVYSTTYDVTSELLRNASITGLELEGQGNNTDFAGRDPKFIWRLNSPDTALEPSEYASGIPHPLLKGYLVQILDPMGTLKREVYTSNPEFIYRFEDNLADNGNNPLRTFTIRVAAVDKNNHVSKSGELTVTNPAPYLGASPPDLGDSVLTTIQGGNLVLNYVKPNDPDFAGILVFLSPNTPSRFDTIAALLKEDGETLTEFAKQPFASGGCLAYSGSDTQIVLPLPSANYHFIIAPFDSFGYDSLHFYGPKNVSVSGIEDDAIPPATPTIESFTTESIIGNDGAEVVKLRLKLTPNNEADLAKYHWSLREVSTQGGVDPTYVGGVPDYHSVVQSFTPVYGLIPARESSGAFVSAPIAEWIVKANTGYEVRVAASDSSENVSAWTALASTTYLRSSKDSVVPNMPTGVSAAASYQTVYVTWQNVADKDLRCVRLYMKSVVRGAAAPDAPTFVDGAWGDGGVPSAYKEVFGTACTIPGLSAANDYYFWLSSVDTSGNETADTLAATGIVQPGSIPVADVPGFDPSALFGDVIYIEGAEWTPNNGAGTISWNEHTLHFQGADYTITANSASLGASNHYLIWTVGETTYTAQPGKPTAETQFAIIWVASTPSAFQKIWTFDYNAVIGSAWIRDAAIKSAMIENLTADQIRAGTINGYDIALACGFDNSGAIHSEGTAYDGTGTPGFWLGRRSVQGVANAHFFLGQKDVSSLTYDGSTLRLKGSVIELGAMPTLDANSSKGLFIGSNIIGFFDHSKTPQWQAYLDSDGNFNLGGYGGTEKLNWNGSALTIKGNIYAEGGKIANLNIYQNLIGLALEPLQPTFKGANTFFYLEGLTGGLRFSLGPHFSYLRDVVNGTPVDEIEIGPLKAVTAGTSSRIFMGDGVLNTATTPFFVDNAGNFSLGQALSYALATQVLKLGANCGVSPEGMWFGGADYASATFKVSPGGAVIGDSFIATNHLAQNTVTHLFTNFFDGTKTNSIGGLLTVNVGSGPVGGPNFVPAGTKVLVIAVVNNTVRDDVGPYEESYNISQYWSQTEWSEINGSYVQAGLPVNPSISGKAYSSSQIVIGFVGSCNGNNPMYQVRRLRLDWLSASGYIDTKTIALIAFVFKR
jgi:predicted phage tail protein